MTYNSAIKLAPKILILNSADVLQYTYETSQTSATPTQNFTPVSARLHLGTNDDHGYFSFMIEDSDLAFVTTGANPTSKIKQQWNIQLYMGKDQAGLERWFNGKVFRTQLFRPNSNTCLQFVYAIGWGVRGTDRISNMKRFQAKLSDGLLVDSTDTNVQASELIKDIWNDTDHFAFRNLPTETEVVSAGMGNVQTIDIKFADFQESFSSWTHMMARLCSATGAMYGIDADRKLYFHEFATVDSGFLVTNDTTGTLSTNWNQNKIAYTDGEYNIEESTEKSGYNVLHGIGTAQDKLDIAQTTENANFDLSTRYIAIPFTPTQSRLQKIGLRVRRLGTATSDNLISIVGATSATSGSPVVTDVRKKISLTKERINNVSTSANEWVELGFEQLNLTPLNLYFVIVPLFGDAVNSFYLGYNTGAVANAYYDSTNGTSWTTRTGGQVPAFALRTYPTYAVNFTLFDTRSYRLNFQKIREKIIAFRDLGNIDTIRQTLIGISEQLTKPKKALSTISISAPNARLECGKTITFVDSLLSMNEKLVLLSVDATMSADSLDNLGIGKLTLSVDKFQ